jgi:ABC-type lipoprotein release transport system permease subunit
LRPLTPIESRQLVRYRIRDKQDRDGRIKMDVVRLLGSLRPNFEEAYPLLAVPARVNLETGSETLLLTGTEPGDPTRFVSELDEGTWLANGSPLQVVLPADLAGRLGCTVGRGLDVRLARGDRVRGETITLRLVVVGLTRGKEVHVPARLARDVQLWRNRELEYHESKQAFESLLEISRQSGCPRYTFFATDEDSVERLVQRLRGLGYHTEDHLEQQKDVRRLGRVLVAIVVFFVSAYVLIAAITVGLTTALSIQSKVWEIGILRSLGVPSRDVLGIFLLQGLVLGVTAFITALGIFALVEGPFRRLAAQALAIREPAFLQGSPFDAGLLWLPLVVAGVSLGCSLLGVLLPSLGACRLIPAEALRRRD